MKGGKHANRLMFAHIHNINKYIIHNSIEIHNSNEQQTIISTKYSTVNSYCFVGKNILTRRLTDLNNADTGHDGLRLRCSHIVLETCSGVE